MAVTSTTYGVTVVRDTHRFFWNQAMSYVLAPTVFLDRSLSSPPPILKTCFVLFTKQRTIINFFIGVGLLYNIVLVSAEQPSESAVHVHLSPPS